MRKEIFASLAVVGIVATVAVLNTNSIGSSTRFLDTNNQIDVEFSKYMAKLGKSYATKEEYLFRRNLFE